MSEPDEIIHVMLTEGTLDLLVHGETVELDGIGAGMRRVPVRIALQDIGLDRIAAILANLGRTA